MSPDLSHPTKWAALCPLAPLCFVCLFWRPLSSPGWPLAQCVAEEGPDLLTLLLQSPEHWLQAWASHHALPLWLSPSIPPSLSLPPTLCQCYHAVLQAFYWSHLSPRYHGGIYLLGFPRGFPQLLLHCKWWWHSLLKSAQRFLLHFK